ncbi:MAG: dihydroorotase [Gloeomargarita sp. SKYG116]|nr:dihydroorotase [Gloeomargarita sp. SKYG116]MCS7226035.1 dihydroorotase [Gloeomargarita sp. SKYB31]MDW8401933.1 dihydroorotase [Gloeomargarita sp. SKYGB_i_bin116]
MAGNAPSAQGLGLPTGTLDKGDVLLRQVRLLDPASGRDEVTDVQLQKGTIQAIGLTLPNPDNLPEYRAQGWVLGPGLVDLYSQSSEPGYEGRETLEQLVQQAWTGGFTRLTLLPHTQPVVDNGAVVTWWRQQQTCVPVKLQLWGALTQGAQGQQMAELRELAQAGVVGFGEGRPCVRWELLQQILRYAQPLGKPVMLWPCDTACRAHGVARPGVGSLTLGLPETPAAAETAVLAGICEWLRLYPTPVHLMRISTARSVALIAQAKEAGLPITASTPWTHLLWDSSHLTSYNPYLRFDPPLGNPDDRQALIAGLKSGVIDAIAIDHQAYTYEEKMVPFAMAPPGINGLSVALSYLWAGLVVPQYLTPLELWSALSAQPLACLGLAPVSLTPGQAAECTLFAPDEAPPARLPLPGTPQGRVQQVLTGD